MAQALLYLGARTREEGIMLHWALVFFVIAIIASVLGFRGIAGMTAEIGWVFAVIAIVLLVVGLVSGVVARGPTSIP